MHEQSSPPSDERTLRADLVRVESIVLYEVTENELEALEKGPPNQDLNYAISLISTVLAFGVAWATSDFMVVYRINETLQTGAVTNRTYRAGETVYLFLKFTINQIRLK